MYVLDAFDADLKHLGLHEVVRATCFKINISIPNFYAILKMYCSTLGMFFTPIGKLGMALHEMWEVSNLPMGSKPYEEYFPCTKELAQPEKDKLAM